MRRFYLVRLNDHSGVSGTGVIAEGCCFSDWTCHIRWLTELRSEGRYPNPEEMMKIHGHDGGTILYWLDETPPNVETLDLAVSK